ncbi:MAG: S8 family serine peptidase [Thermoplasmata archaeon]
MSPAMVRTRRRQAAPRVRTVMSMVVLLAGTIAWSPMLQAITFKPALNPARSPLSGARDDNPPDEVKVMERGSARTCRAIPLRLRAGEFDPLKDETFIPGNLKSSGEDGCFIVQFDGPVRQDWVAWLEGRCGVLAYLPDFAFVVRAPPSVADGLRTHPHIRFVGPFHPAYRLHPELAPDGRLRTLSVLAFSDSLPGRLARELESLGAEVVGVEGPAVFIRAPDILSIQIARLPDVQWVEELRPDAPHNYKTSLITSIRSPTDGPYNFSSDSCLWSYNSSYGGFEGYTGGNMTVAVCDTGVDGTHPAFEGRKKLFFSYTGSENWTDTGWHGTHVSGTVLGSGAYRPGHSGTAGYYGGMAPGAQLVGQARSFSGAGAYATYCRDASRGSALVQSNSWGSSGADHGDYDSRDVIYDRSVRDSDPDREGNQSLCIVFSAGNDGPGNGTVQPPATAKNVIAVGATDKVNGTTVASFSARGHCDDGRIKPDLVAPGVSVVSTSSNASSSYITASGTSMACPVVAGAAVVVCEHFCVTRGLLPSPAMVKAVLINGAEPLADYSWPGPEQGWGRLNLSRALLNTTARKIWVEDQQHKLATGESRDYQFRVVGGSELRVTLVWSDVPGTVNANFALVNDLNLIVSAPDGTTYMGNSFAGGFSVPGNGSDNVNNIEQVRIASPAEGWWGVRVSGANVPSGAQDYALVISGKFVHVFPETTDLSVLNLSASPAEPEEGETILLSAELFNAGPVALPGLRYRFTVGGAGGPEAATIDGGLGGLRPGETAPVSASWTATRGLWIVAIEADPFDDIPERSEDNNSLSVELFVRGYGVRLETGAERIAVDPGEEALLEVGVVNTGNTADTYSISLEGQVLNGWTAKLSDTSVVVPRCETRQVWLTVAPPTWAGALESCSLWVRCTSTGNSSHTASVQITVVVNHLFGLNLTAERWEGLVDPGASTLYILRLENTGNGPDQFNLFASGPTRGWRASLFPRSAELEAGGWTDIALTVSSPPWSLAGQCCTVEVSAVDAAGIRSSLTITTMVRPRAGLEVEVVKGIVSVRAGEVATLAARLSNTGNFEEEFDTDALAPPGLSARTEPPIARLRPGGSAIVLVRVSLTASHPPGEVGIAVRVAPRSDASMARSVNITLAILQRYCVWCDAVERERTVESGSGVDFVLIVTNTGTGPDLIRLSLPGALPEGWKASLSPAELELQPGESADVILSMTTPASRGSSLIAIPVRAISSGDGRIACETVVLLHATPITAPGAPKPPSPLPPSPEPPAPTPEPTISTERSSIGLVAALALAALFSLLVCSAALFMRLRRRRWD